MAEHRVNVSKRAPGRRKIVDTQGKHGGDRAEDYAHRICEKVAPSLLDAQSGSRYYSHRPHPPIKKNTYAEREAG